MKEEIMDFKDSKVGVSEGLEEGKRRGNGIIIF